MTLRTVLLYGYVCDACGARSAEGIHPAGVWEWATEASWVEIDGRHFCWECAPAGPSEPDDRAGGLPPRHGTGA